MAISQTSYADTIIKSFQTKYGFDQLEITETPHVHGVHIYGRKRGQGANLMISEAEIHSHSNAVAAIDYSLQRLSGILDSANSKSNQAYGKFNGTITIPFTKYAPLGSSGELDLRHRAIESIADIMDIVQTALINRQEVTKLIMTPDQAEVIMISLEPLTQMEAVNFNSICGYEVVLRPYD